MRLFHNSKVIASIIVLCLFFSINVEATEENSSRGTPVCSPLLISSLGIGENLMMSGGTPGCIVDLLSTDQCASPSNVGPIMDMTFLGTYLLDVNGEINTGITTMSTCYVAYPSQTTMTPIGTMYIPVDRSFIPFMTEAVLESPLPISVQYDGIEGTIIYNGTTYSGLPEGPFNLQNLNGNVTNVTTRTTGFDGAGAPLVSEQIHPIDFVSATCTTSQSPDSTVFPVDFGTVLTLGLNSIGATSASINGSQMTVNSGTPGIDNNISWEATHTVEGNETITGVVSNPNGETSSCQWSININSDDPTILSVAAVGENGIVITGTPDVTYSIRITQGGNITTYDVTVGFNGEGTLNVTVPPAALIEVGQQGIPSVTDSFMTASCGAVLLTPPVLGESLLISDGWANCPIDLYVSENDCSSIFDPGTHTFLGSYTLDANGQVNNTGIATTPTCYVAYESGTTTNPLGSMFIPADYTSLPPTLQATIGESFSLSLSYFSIDGGTVIYDGISTTGIPDGTSSGDPNAPFTFTLPNNIVGDATELVTSANGFDGTGLPISDDTNHTLDFVPPTCSSSQNPDSTVTPVDEGTVITLFLNTTGAISASINNTPMSPDIDPNTNNMVQWTATHTAVQDTTLTGTATNPDGETVSCQWSININTVDPTIFSVADIGDVGIVIAGTPFATYTIRTTDPFGSINNYDIQVEANGLGTLQIVITAGTLYEVGQLGLPIVTDSFMTDSVPVASNVNITDANGGSLLVGDVLTGNYTYADADGDAEGVSSFRWLRDNNPISGATALSYSLVAADSGANITFEVTPIAATGTNPGSAVTSMPVVVGNSIPVANDVTITGTAAVGNSLTGNYTYSDVDQDLEGISSYRWLRDNIAISNATATTYTLVAADSGKNIIFEVTPIAESGTNPGLAETSMPIVIGNTPPVASNVNITGTLTVGSILTGNYTYSDVDQDLEGTSTYKWFRSGVAISGATSTEYSIVAADSGKTISFEVTPVAETGSGAVTGTPVSSAGVVIGVYAIPTLSSGFLLILIMLIGWVGFRHIRHSM